MRLPNPFKGRQPGTNATTTTPPPVSTTGTGPTTGPLVGSPQNRRGPGLEHVQGGQLNLVNYSPEELLEHVEHTLSRVHFGMNRSTSFMENVSQLWAIAGPAVLLAGTAGEVFYFIWQYTSNPAWWVAMSVLATVIVLEATFMVVSWKSATIRNRAEGRSDGPSDLDKKKLRRYQTTWFTLGIGVGAGQIAFLISAMSYHLGNLTVLALFAVVRTVMTLASDYYTAFVHEEKPTGGDEEKAKQEQHAQLASQLLEQKTREVELLNKGIERLQRAHTEATIAQEKLTTELEVNRLENQNRISALRAVQEQSAMMSHLGEGMLRALFDPKMPENERQQLLGTLQALMQASSRLPSPGHITIEEDDGV